MFICEKDEHCIDCPKNYPEETCEHWIEVERVVHGEWIVHNSDNPFAIYGECPVCHEEVGRKWNYCPNCGAKMNVHIFDDGDVG